MKNIICSFCVFMLSASIASAEEIQSITEELGLHSPSLEGLRNTISMAKEKKDIIALVSLAIQLHYLETVSSKISTFTDSKTLLDEASDFAAQLDSTQDNSAILHAIQLGYMQVESQIESLETAVNEDDMALGLAGKKTVFTIYRQASGPKCTEGYIAIDGKIVGYTLELADRGNITNISSIPRGTYKAVIRTDGSKKWRLELRNVPGRSGVQIHVGNWTSQIKGCLLVGTNIDRNGCHVINSRDALSNMERAIALANTGDITVNIAGAR